MTDTASDFTATSEDEDVTVDVIVHVNGDRTIVPAGLSDDDKASIALLSGEELHAAVAEHVQRQLDESNRQQLAEATQAVVNDPPAPSLSSTAPLAGPDPVVQGGSSTGGEGGAGAVFPTTVPAPGVGNAETVKATEAADPSSGAQPVDQGDAETADPGADTTTGDTATTPRNSGPNV